MTETEKLTYWKGLIQDTDVLLDIVLFGMDDFSVRIRGLTQRDQELTEEAMLLEQRDGRALGVETCLTAIQKYCLMFQLVKINGESFARADSKDPALTAKVLREMTVALLGSMNPQRLQLLCRAVLIYEMKIKLCNDAVANRRYAKTGFWKASATA